jgi:hypothetical protein
MFLDQHLFKLVVQVVAVQEILAVAPIQEQREQLIPVVEQVVLQSYLR